MAEENTYIYRNEDLVKFKELIKVIKANNCVAFVGAGVSVNKGYRQWENLLYDKSINGKPSGLIEYTGIKNSDVPNLSYPEIVDHCIEIIGNRKYYRFLRKEYKRKANELSDNHLLLCKTNFRHIVSTNFDPCLYDNAEGFISELKTYPGNILTPEIMRTLYYIHGRAFITSKENNSKETKLFKNLIFGAKMYDFAYKQDLMIRSFIYNMLLNDNQFLFLGFGWKDVDFIKMIESVTIAKQNFLDKSVEINNIPLRKREIGYALLSYPIEEEMHLEKIKLLGSNKYRDTIKELENTLNEFRKLESELKKVGIIVIGFDKIDEKFTGLTNLIQIMKDKATYFNIDKPLERINASLTASVTGSLS